MYITYSPNASAGNLPFPTEVFATVPLLEILNVNGLPPTFTLPVFPKTIRSVSLLSNEASLVSITDNAFADCSGLTNFSMASNILLSSVGASAFAGCSNLIFPQTTITNSIGANAFSDIANTQLYLSFNIQQNIACNETFADIPHLTNLTINIVTGCILSVPSNFLQNAPALQALLIYGDISGLTIPPMPASINSISITTPTSPPPTYCSIAPNAFAGITGFSSFLCDLPVINVGASAFENCTSCSIDFKTIVVLDISAFSGCTQLQTINIDTVSFINDGAFVGCSNLTTVQIGNIGFVGDNVFAGCSKLASVQLNIFNGGMCNEPFSYPTLTNLSLNVLNNPINDASGIFLANNFCQNAIELHTLDISGTVAADIDISGFLNCVNLQQINLQFASGTYFYSQLYNLRMLNSVTILGAYITATDFLQGCYYLDSIHVDNLLTNIDYYTLSYVRHMNGIHAYGLIPSHYF